MAQLDIKEVVNSISSDVKYLMETIASHLPDNATKAMIQGQLLVVNKLLSDFISSNNGIPSLRNRPCFNPNQLVSESFAKSLAEESELPQRRSLGNEWAENLPPVPGKPPKKKKVPKNEIPEPEVHEVPPSVRCPGCNDLLINGHPFNENYEKHAETGQLPIQSCVGDVFYIV